MHDSIRQNVLCFLADLFVGLEVKPVVKSVQLPGVKKDRIIDIPDPGKQKKIHYQNHYEFVVGYKMHEKNANHYYEANFFSDVNSNH